MALVGNGTLFSENKSSNLKNFSVFSTVSFKIEVYIYKR